MIHRTPRPPRGAECPRCGRSHSDPASPLCPDCLAALARAASSDAPDPSSLTVHLGPILRQALASTQAGEDFDEALLRALKAHHPDQAAALLSAATRAIQLEAGRAGEDRMQTVRRLAQSDPGPRIVLTGAGGPTTEAVTKTEIYRIGGKEYHSLDEMPPDVRRIVEQARAGGAPELDGRTGPRMSCSWALLGGCLLALLRLTPS